jgi:hypothetical protein
MPNEGNARYTPGKAWQYLQRAEPVKTVVENFHRCIVSQMSKPEKAVALHGNAPV